MLSSLSRRSISSTIVGMPGHGIGPEVFASVVSIFDAAQVPVNWEVIDLSGKPEVKEPINTKSLDLIRRHKIGLKGPTTTPIGGGHVSLNVYLRRELNLFANVRPCMSVPGVKTLYDNVNLITIRENTEGEYSGKEHEVVPGVIENLKIISEKACTRVAKYAFEIATKLKRKKIHALHKASVMKMGDGLFLKKTREIAKDYPLIDYQEKNVDTACGILVSTPEVFDVMVMPNLYGDIVSDVCSGLVGGLGLTPSGNIGEECSVFEAVHGSAPDIAGKNIANPTALLFSSIMMLRHLEHYDHADRILKAVHAVLLQGTTRTRDLGGNSSTTEYTKAIINSL
jgi:isocitrate dehydrogenase (NAD+)